MAKEISYQQREPSAAFLPDKAQAPSPSKTSQLMEPMPKEAMAELNVGVVP
jgi:hypothetical protein